MCQTRILSPTPPDPQTLYAWICVNSATKSLTIKEHIYIYIYIYDLDCLHPYNINMLLMAYHII